MPLSSEQEAYVGQLVTQLSEARLNPYFVKSPKDPVHALARYYWNVELCQAFYPLLHTIEVALRNNIDSALHPVFPVAQYDHIDSWIDRRPRVAVHPHAESAIHRSKCKLPGWDESTKCFTRKAPTHGDLVANMSFGFWVGLLENTYDSPGKTKVYFWPDHFKTVFPGASGTLMSPLRTAFNQLRHFRNRVFHHEPVWQKRETDPTPKERYDALCTTLRWLGGPQYSIATSLHPVPLTFDESTAIPAMETRLLTAVDKVLERAAAKKLAKKKGRDGDGKNATARIGEAPRSMS